MELLLMPGTSVPARMEMSKTSGRVTAERETALMPKGAEFDAASWPPSSLLDTMKGRWGMRHLELPASPQKETQPLEERLKQGTKSIFTAMRGLF